MLSITKIGKKWADISKTFTYSRSENAVKNRYNCLIKREGLNILEKYKIIKNGRGSSRKEEEMYQ
jgi:hypothetical protein